MNKFKVGDIVFKKGCYDQKILCVGVDSYFTEMDTGVTKANSAISFNEEHLWKLKPKQINKESLIEAWNKLVPSRYELRVESSGLFQDLCKELGL